MLVISTQNWSILAKFAKKNPSKSAVFYWLFLGEVSPPNFPWNRPIFLRICPKNPSKFDFFPLKSCEIGRFFCEFWLSPAKIPRNRPIFERILTFFPRKSREIGRFFREFAPENPAKFCFFFREISEALLNSGWARGLLIIDQQKIYFKFWNLLQLSFFKQPNKKHS